jgi:hypothetical protein
VRRRFRGAGRGGAGRGGRALTRSRCAQLPAGLEGNSVMARLQDYALKQKK